LGLNGIRFYSCASSQVPGHTNVSNFNTTGHSVAELLTN